MEWNEEQQEAINQIVKERLSREKAKFSELELAFKELESQHKEVCDKFAQAQKDIEELPQLRRKLVIEEVIKETSLPAYLADRLVGETREELLQDAQKLSESLGTLQPIKGISKTPQGNGEIPKKGMQLIIDKMQNTDYKR